MQDMTDEDIVESWYQIGTRETLDIRCLESFFRFTAVWIAFNAIYSERYPRKTGGERNQVVAFAKDNSVLHARCLASRAEYREAVNYIKSKGVVNVLLGTRDQVKDEAILEEVLNCVYTIRCNFLHGDKQPGDIRDQNLVQSGYQIIAGLLSEPTTRKLH